jgi:hypothetical protein
MQPLMNIREQVWLLGFTKMADDSEDEMSDQTSESWMKYQEIQHKLT